MRVSEEEIARWIKETSEEIGVMLVAGLPTPGASLIDRCMFDLRDLHARIKELEGGAK